VDSSTVRTWIAAVADDVDAQAEHLTQLDSAIGDADHGTNLQRGFTAVRRALDEAAPDTPAGDLVMLAGRTLVSTVGGASGPLYGSAFRAIGKQLRTDPDDLPAALRAGLAAVQKLGAAQPGDKTMVDAYAPALEAWEQSVLDGEPPEAAAAKAADAAEEGMRATVPMVARKGRASYLGPRSAGHQDPGATSTAFILRALADSLR
jgi:phosphoenolpyruvate---glycerone phosphotransferase subunit DhaL